MGFRLSKPSPKEIPHHSDKPTHFSVWMSTHWSLTMNIETFLNFLENTRSANGDGGRFGSEFLEEDGRGRWRFCSWKRRGWMMKGVIEYRRWRFCGWKRRFCGWKRKMKILFGKRRWRLLKGGYRCNSARTCLAFLFCYFLVFFN